MNDIDLAKARFLQCWGEMGSAWGINKTMAQLHAILMVADHPLTTDDVMKELEISRGNASMNLRSLVHWGLVRRSYQKGDRKEYFQSEMGVWKMFCAIARERKRREIEPVITGLEECLELSKEKASSENFRAHIEELLEFSKTIDFLLGQVARQENSKIIPVLVRLLGGRPPERKKRSNTKN